MIRFSLLGSGSKGNAIFVASQKTKILIDNGFSFRQLQLRLSQIGERVEDLSAVFITHEHSDHTQGIGTLIKKVRLPVYLTRATLEAIQPALNGFSRVELFEAGDTVPLSDMFVTSFSVSHDAVDPVNFVITSDETKLGIAADMGYASKLAFARLQGANGLVLEANHCPNLLMSGKYPAFLKQRILGKFGHLSNQAMKEFLCQLLHRDLKLVVLAHISEENNTPELALQNALSALSSTGIPVYLASQNSPTPVFEIAS